jgi:hypothetical protein
MKPIKVNGVVVHCSDCINHMVSIDDAPCKNCWKAICHTGDISGVCLDDIAFYPKDKEHFLAVEWSVVTSYQAKRGANTNLSAKAKKKKLSDSKERLSEQTKTSTTE